MLNPRQWQTQSKRKSCRYHRRCWSRFLITAAVVVCLCSSVWTAHGGGIDPYRILGVSRAASPVEIKKRYRKLCLQYHPDKNVNKPAKERDLCETKFKEVQTAFDMIENKKFGGSPFDSQSNPFGQGWNDSGGRGYRSNPQSQHPFASDPIVDAFVRRFTRNNNVHFSFHRTGSGFGASPFGMGATFPTRNPSSSDSFHPLDMPFKSIYVQPVKVPLEDLYKGVTSFNFELQDNLYTRYRASIRGKMIFYSLFLATSYALPVLRTSKLLALLVGLCVIHGTTPQPDPSESYIKPLQKGDKGGDTIVKFAKSRELEIEFQIQEAKHPVYRRDGDDLHAEVTITSKEAEKGCKKTIRALDSSENAIEITIPRNKYSYKKQRKEHRKNGYNDSVTIRGRGWPIRKDTESNKKNTNRDDGVYDYGDLMVTIRVKKPSVK